MAAKQEVDKLMSVVNGGEGREALQRVEQVLDVVTDAAIGAWVEAAAETVKVFQDLLGREAVTGDADVAKLGELAQLLQGDFQADNLKAIIRGQLLEVLSNPASYFAMANAAGKLQEVAVLDNETRVKRIKELLVCLGFGDQIAGKVDGKKVARAAKIRTALEEAPTAAVSLVTNNQTEILRFQDEINTGGYAQVRDLLQLPYLHLGGEVMIASFIKALEADEQVNEAMRGLRQHGEVFKKVTAAARDRARSAKRDVEEYNAKKAAYLKKIEEYRTYGLVKEGELVGSDVMATMLEEVFANLGETRTGYEEQMKLRNKVTNVHPPKIQESVRAVAGSWDAALGVQDMIASIEARRDSWIRVGLVSVETAAALQMALVTVTNHLITTANDRQVLELKAAVAQMFKFIAQGKVSRSRAFAQACGLLPRPDEDRSE